MLNFIKKIFSPFAKIKSQLGAKIRFLFSRGVDESTIEHLEQIFYEADLGAKVSTELAEKIRRQKPEPKTIIPFIKSELQKIFTSLPPVSLQSPHVILIVGVNGSGKTTSIAKLARHYKKQGKKVLIAAGDTFRAAAVEQLEAWAKRIDVDIVKSQTFADPSAVAFDALSAAKARNTDIVLIDTAGRLQNKTDLMHELAKLRRVCQKQIPDSPHETLLVIDGTVGQNALDQARVFHEFTPITGIILTKLDGSAKGGIAVSIQKELNIPIRWVGMGEAEEDLFPFDVDAYLDALLKE
ncbi:MAG TPA: signal recognition particle-docking protein FtsY [Chlamydiales bacterium]|nr:signal recognition particle-docking protein FtsY [Chlamydiales bacterium]